MNVGRFRCDFNLQLFTQGLHQWIPFYPDLNLAPAEELQMVEEKADEATDDIVGIHESDDLNKLLPNENYVPRLSRA